MFSVNLKNLIDPTEHDTHGGSTGSDCPTEHNAHNGSLGSGCPTEHGTHSGSPGPDLLLSMTQ